VNRSGCVTGGFCLLILWFGVVNGWRLLLVVLSAAAVHELGHILTLKLLGANVTSLRLSMFGAVLETDIGKLPYGKELLVVLAGPAANFLVARLLSGIGGEWWDAAVGAHLVLCGFNLLPVEPLDGGRALYLVTAWLAGPDTGAWVSRWAGVLCGLMLTAGLGYIMWRTGGSLWLLPPAMGMFLAAYQKCFEKREFM